MIRISDVVNSFLKGVALARVKSDLASAIIAQQYHNDPNLESFPVPRAEIRQAEVDMKFGVTETVEKVIDEEHEALTAILDLLPAYIDAVFAIPVKATSTSPDTEYQPLTEFLGDRAEEVRSAFTSAMEADFEGNISAIYAELTESPNRFGRAYLTDKTYTELSSITISRNITVWLDSTSWNRSVRDVAITWSENTSSAINLALETARARYFDLDLGIKKDQLVGIEPHAMSTMKVTIYVQNYEWVESRDVEGNLVEKLVLK